MSNVWKMIQEKKEIAKHMPKKHKHSLVPIQRYQDSRHLLQNPTVPNYVIDFSKNMKSVIVHRDLLDLIIWM